MFSTRAEVALRYWLHDLVLLRVFDMPLSMLLSFEQSTSPLVQSVRDNLRDAIETEHARLKDELARVRQEIMMVSGPCASARFNGRRCLRLPVVSKFKSPLTFASLLV